MRTRERLRLASFAAVFVTLAFVAACSPPPPAPPAAPPGKPVDQATAGAIGGRVTFTGPAPEAEFVKVGTDPACVQGAGPNPQSDAVLIGADGALRNAFVWIKDGLDPGYSFPVPAATVTLDQRGCLYTPRVIGLMAGQSLEILNSDPTMHNVHSLPKVNQEFNKSTPVKGSSMKTTFTAPEVMVRFMCNVHGWMAAYVGVTTHPYFAVTDASGAFELKGVPPGTYTIEAWHEKFGTRTAQVTLTDKQTQTVSFAFTAAASRQ